jgi:RHS repeat-associated protein
MVTQYNGAALSDQQFYPWGTPWNIVNGTDENWASTNGAERFEGLASTPNRDYSLGQGRWLSPDPLGEDAANPSDPQTWNMYAYVRNNPTTLTDPTGMVTEVCEEGTNGQATNCAQLENADFRQFESENTELYFANGNIYANGNLVGTYMELSSDEDEVAQALASAVSANHPGDFIAGVAAASVLGGTGVGLGLYATSASAGLTTLGLRAAVATAPLLPVVPSAIAKLQQLGISLQEAAEIVASPTAQKFIDNAHGGNINVFQNVGDKIVRITLDPTASRIISAGIVQARNLANSIASGRFTPMQ